MRFPLLNISAKGQSGKMLLFSLLLSAAPFLLEAGCVYSTPFQATTTDGMNTLTWSTMNETDNDFFVIERSKDGLSFELAAQVEAAGLSTDEKNYRFVDITAETNRTYYRLLQVDFDGTTAITHTLIVTKQAEDALFDISTISASTTDRYFSVILDSKIDHSMEYRVMTQMGEIMKEGKSQVIKGTNAMSIDLEKLTVGTYQLAIKVKNELEVLNIRKIDGKEMPELNMARKNNSKN